MTLARYNPNRGLTSLRDNINRIIDMTFPADWEDDSEVAQWRPSVDICDKDGETVVHAELPGVKIHVCKYPSVEMIVDAGTDKLLTGQMGPNAARILERANVKSYYCSKGSVQEAIHALEQNQLRELSQNDVRQGPGKMGGRGAGGGRGVCRGRDGGAVESDDLHSTFLSR